MRNEITITFTRIEFAQTFSRRLRKGEWIEPKPGSKVYRVKGKEHVIGPGVAYLLRK